MFEKLKSGLKKIKNFVARDTNEDSGISSTGNASNVLSSKIGLKLSSDIINKVLEDVEIELLSSDVALEAIESFRDDLKKEVENRRVSLGKSREAVIESLFRDTLHNALKKREIDFLEMVKSLPRPVSIMFVGINGSGKTTTIAKVAKFLKDNGFSSVIAAGDTFRAGAIEQISIHGERIGVRVIKHDFGADPAAVAYDAVEHAKAKRRDFVLIDTAGRMHTNVNLMDEMKKIKRVVNPTLIIWVGDSLNGNDIINQVRDFDKVIGVSGTILTKVDVDVKGGAILSVAYAIEKPIYFLGMGQEYNEFLPFRAQWLMNALYS
ncbi:MAG: signal recognition particle-docking protein FtsY [Candidatus Thermoplasmatota archaeon]|jgi:fused signal recognition particle receptor|nr:signal recognition particle-docking protein FtsY [Candidatus Thermoplasmatota archaeon]MCL5963161.1 signal recognition particle-docking protein FtsY [Candidatus Thermoplasmatota archaeon]